MDASEAAKVLIAGGGLAVRRALALRKIPSLTLERRGTPEDCGLAIDLPGNAVHALGPARARRGAAGGRHAGAPPGLPHRGRPAAIVRR